MRITIDVSDITFSLDEELEENEQLAKDEALKTAHNIVKELKKEPPVGTPRKNGIARNGWDVDENGDAPVIFNNVEYINALNNGHSKQSPAGFVEAAIDKFTK
ncbi:hypothetical protein GRI62_11870 [Erythrobacter arachoides]|uniref:HK97 gp10 family phage protein n=1 Tax=Aurantiacibacter arachoides TaxID=1850444 RepID=A0A845A190_9SPHN|nr:hypothetical protein [Aurantiacibacter arachoides]MXO94293.1 hypothetical protein [Aurantiacibacter arachoides]